MRYPKLNGSAHIGSPDIRIGPRRQLRPEEQPQFEIRNSFFNTTGSTLTVCHRNGMKVAIPSRPVMSGNAFVVRVEITVRGDVKENLRDTLSRVTDDSPNEMRLIKEAFDKQSNLGSYAQRMIALEYPITLDQIRKAGGTIYYHELDLLLSLSDPEFAMPHPYSEDGRKLSMVVDAPVDLNEASFGYCIEIIDNAGMIGERYLNINSDIYKVVPKLDPSRRDGVYVITHRAVDNATEVGNQTEVQHFASDEQGFESLGLYRTFTDATHLGDVSVSRKEELARLEHETTLLKGQLQKIKAAHEIEIASLNERLQKAELEANTNKRQLDAAMERERHQSEMERIRTKDYYEDRSIVRKDSNEALKVIPAIIVGIGACIAAWKAIFA